MSTETNGPKVNPGEIMGWPILKIDYPTAPDKIAAGNAFGSGYHEAEMTLPTQPPPLGKPTKVRFPLAARRVIEQAPSTLFLEAELYWGGEKQHTLRKTIEHVYSRGNGRF